MKFGSFGNMGSFSKLRNGWGEIDFFACKREDGNGHNREAHNGINNIWHNLAARDVKSWTKFVCFIYHVLQVSDNHIIATIIERENTSYLIF